MKQVKSSVLASRLAAATHAAKFAHLLAKVLLLPDTGIFNAAKLIAMKESREEILLMVTAAGDVYASTMNEQAQSITLYVMNDLCNSFTADSGDDVKTLLERIDQLSATNLLPTLTLQEADLVALTASKQAQDGVRFDFEELVVGLLGAPVFLRIDVNYPDVYEGKREEGVQA